MQIQSFQNELFRMHSDYENHSNHSVKPFGSECQLQLMFCLLVAFQKLIKVMDNKVTQCMFYMLSVCVELKV